MKIKNLKSSVQEVAKLATFVLICIGFILLVFEYAVTPFVYGRQQIPNRALALLGLIANPNTKVDDTAINSQGFTGAVLNDVTPGNGAIRILTLGGSTLFDRRLTERLSERLSGATPRKIELVGGALRTHTSRSSVIKYNYFRKFKFDYVLIYDGMNELWANNVKLEDYRSDYSHLGPWYKRNYILDHFLIARYVYNLKIWRKPLSQVNGANFRSEIDFEHNLRTLIKTIKDDKATPLLMTFAWNIPADYNLDKFLSNQLSYYNPNNYDKCAVEIWGDPDYVRAGIQRINVIIKKIAEDEKVLLLDQEELLRGKIEYFGDVCHLNDEGVDLFLDNIKLFLVAHGILS